VSRFKAASADTFRSLHIRNFRLFMSGQVISQVGNWLTLVAQTLLVFKLTHSGVALGLLTAFQFGPVLLLGPYGGLVADRSDKRRLVLMVQTLAMVQSFSLAALAFLHHPPLAAIFAVACFGGFTTAFDNPARRSLVMEMVPHTEVNNAVALNSATMTCSRVVGPALAGLLIAGVGFGWCFAADGFSYLAVLAGLWMMDTRELHQPPVSPRGKGQVREGMRYARSVPELWVPLVMMALMGTFAFNFNTVLPLFVTRDLHGTELTYPLLMSVLSIGSLAGALYAARRKTITVDFVTMTAVLFGVGMTLLTVAPNTPVAFAFGLVVGLASISFTTAATAIVQLAAEPSMRGRVLALQAMVFLGSTPIGGPIVGTIAQVWGARWSLALGAAACFAATAVGLAHRRRTGLEAAAVAAAAEVLCHGESAVVEGSPEAPASEALPAAALVAGCVGGNGDSGALSPPAPLRSPG
jgi:MFS family permease